jgi:translation initiation factor 2B subunit (eIF-2B alpha/beta/delta family)
VKSKVLVLSGIEKIASPESGDECISEENSLSEVSRIWKETTKGAQVIEDALSRDDPRISVKNAYFELVPAKLIDQYITEEGIWSTQQIQQRSKWISDEIEQCFKYL